MKKVYEEILCLMNSLQSHKRPIVFLSPYFYYKYPNPTIDDFNAFNLILKLMENHGWIAGIEAELKPTPYVANIADYQLVANAKSL